MNMTNNIVHDKMDEKDMPIEEVYDINEENEIANTEYEKEPIDSNGLKNSISKQIWSIKDIVKKIQADELILDPEYQRREDLWSNEKKVQFIESLLMGIHVPPIYTVELEEDEDDLFAGTMYEVVDGKQRMHTIKTFFNNEFKLEAKYLSYFKEEVGNKKYLELMQDSAGKKFMQDLGSYVIDNYVIKSTVGTSLKYDIFERLNKGAKKLNPNEIRRASYSSELIKYIDNIVEDLHEKELTEYLKIFNKGDYKRFNDCGKYYAALAFEHNTNIEFKVVDNYNSRPVEMINNYLEAVQKKVISFDIDHVNSVLNSYNQLAIIEGITSHEIYAFVGFVSRNLLTLEQVAIIRTKEKFNETITASATTTRLVNKRIKIIMDYINENPSC